MTDARYPGRWLNDRRIARLSDPAHRLFVVSLAWSAENRTDGVIEPADLALMPGCAGESVAELTGSGLWFAEPDGTWLISVYADTQITSDQLDALDRVRMQQRERKARQRQKAGQASLFDDPERDIERDIERDKDRDIPRDVRRDNTGQDRTGLSTNRSTDEPTARASSNGHAPCRFDDFWTAYPRKSGKIKARQSWDKATATADPALVVAGARRYAADPNRSDQFTKLPATWLNQGCWDDEPLPLRRPEYGDDDSANWRPA